MTPPSLPTFEEAYEAHFDFVWRSLRRLGVREADTSDAAQDVFLVVHRRLDSFEGRAKLTTWLFRISLHVASEYRRRAHVRREVLDESALELFEDPGLDAEATHARNQHLRVLERALDSMSLPQRTVFVLFELEGLLCPEIAEILEIPLGTVYSRLRVGRMNFETAARRRARLPMPNWAEAEERA